MDERCSIGTCANRVKYVVMGWRKQNTLRWIGLVYRIKLEKFVKNMNVSEIKVLCRKGRSIGRWKYRVTENRSERGASRREMFEQAKTEYLDRERWRHFCYDHHLGRHSWG